MAFVDTIILSLTQGATEFLPVSSSGHLLAARLLLGISDTQGTSFDAFLHLGTLLAVLVYYRKVWWGIFRSVITNDDESHDKRELFAKIAIASVPAAIAGYLFQGPVSEALRTPEVLVIALLLTAVALYVFDKLAGTEVTIHRASFKDASLIGLIQVAALIPGVSRSGITIAAGRGRGLSRKQATNFSFLMSAPIIAGAGLSSLPALIAGAGFAPEQLLLGFILSFASGLIAICILLKIISKISFLPFVIYLVALAGVIVWYV